MDATASLVLRYLLSGVTLGVIYSLSFYYIVNNQVLRWYIRFPCASANLANKLFLL